MLPENRIPTHPGAILREQFLGPLGLSRASFAHHLGIPVEGIEALVEGTQGVTPEIARLLAQALDTTPDFWASLQRNHDLAARMPKRGASR